MYLVDTNVISAGAPARVARDDLVDWMTARSDSLFISVVSIMEIEDGIAKSRRDGASRKAADLMSWLDTILHLYGARLLPISIEVARVAGGLSDIARGKGQAPGLADILIAATAQNHGLIVLTRNLKHIAPLGVPCQNPFDALPRG